MIFALVVLTGVIIAQGVALSIITRKLLEAPRTVTVPPQFTGPYQDPDVEKALSVAKGELPEGPKEPSLPLGL